MAIRQTTIAVTGATGGAGVATATGYSDGVVDGEIVALHFAYLDTPPATTDVTITESGVSPAQTIITVSDAATDGWFYPMAQAVNQANAAITNQGRPIRVAGQLKAVIAQANNGDGVTVTVRWDDLQ